MDLIGDGVLVRYFLLILDLLTIIFIKRLLGIICLFKVFFSFGVVKYDWLVLFIWLIFS